MTTALEPIDPFLVAFRGTFTSALRWPQLDALWTRVRERADAGWFLYAVGEPPPSRPAERDQVLGFIVEMDGLLRAEHRYDYCGIVYADDPERPSLIKIYDPGHLGVSCGSSASPPLPGWVMSLIAPCDLPAVQPPPGNRRRWWRRIFA